METFDEKELHQFLLQYEVSPPSARLVDSAKRLMREEMAKAAPVAVHKSNRTYLLVSLSLIMSMCIFYLFTVGTVLNFTLPPYLLGYLRYSIFVFSWMSACIMTGAVALIFLKQQKLLQCRVI